MLIAVALDDEGGISSHLGKSDCFAVYEVDDEGQRLLERRPNPHAESCSGHFRPGPASEGCGHHDTEPAGGPKRGAWIPPVMQGCSAVIAGFVPPPARQVLRSVGCQPVLAAPGGDPEAAIVEFLDGNG